MYVQKANDINLLYMFFSKSHFSNLFTKVSGGFELRICSSQDQWLQ